MCESFGLFGAHFLMAGADDNADFKRFVRLAKQRSGWRFKRITGTRLWQEGFYDRVLRSDESTEVVARYILGNPIRARLVQSIEEYPFWGSGAHTREALIEYVGK